MKGSGFVLLEGLILGILVGIMRGGRIKRLGFLALRLPIFILIAFILQLSISILIYMGNGFVIQYKTAFFILSYGVLFAALLFNLNYKAMWFILLGALLNFTAIIFNNGRMPIDLSILEKPGFENLLTSITTGALPQYISIHEANSATVYFGKILTLPSWYPIKQIFSIGDLLIALGIFFVVQTMMISTTHRRASKVIQFDHKGRMLR
jgi:hypothetical protein